MPPMIECGVCVESGGTPTLSNGVLNRKPSSSALHALDTPESIEMASSRSKCCDIKQQSGIRVIRRVYGGAKKKQRHTNAICRRY